MCMVKMLINPYTMYRFKHIFGGALVLMKIQLSLVVYLTMVGKSRRLCFNKVSLMSY